MSTRLSILIPLLLAALVLGETAQAQSIFERARRAAERGAERAVEREAERRADRAVTGAIECAVGDRACAEQAQADGQDVTYIESDGTPVADQQAAQSTTQAATGGAAGIAAGDGDWTNYDFVPGHRVMFYDDFSGDIVGRFPRRLTFEEGMLELVEIGGHTMLRSTQQSSRFRINFPEALPDRFTVEFDALLNPTNIGPMDIVAVGTIPLSLSMLNRASKSVFVYARTEAGVRGPRESTTRPNAPGDEIATVRIAVDGDYAVMYLNEQRVANLPNADFPRENHLEFLIGARTAHPTYIGNIRVAAGGREMMYDRLMADGRVVTHGILFTTGSANIQPESTPTLQDIARTMQQHGDLRLSIEGHTDSVGSADANQRLSEQRAQAVVDHLVNREGISRDRLQAVGKGQTEPAADNSTAEGRQTNRRVELVVLN